MEQLKDPRAVRTRQLIVDAFNELLQTKDFEKISIKDITDKATINRATFYSHFVDKYELLELMLSENIVRTMKDHLSCEATLNEQTIAQMFLSIVHLHDNMYAGCRRGYNTFTVMIETKTKEQLTKVIQLFDETIDDVKAVMLSWALYGAYVQWYTTSKETAELFASTLSKTLYAIVSAHYSA